MTIHWYINVEKRCQSIASTLVQHYLPILYLLKSHKNWLSNIIIFDWDCSLKTDAWAKSTEFILQYVNMLDDNVQEGECILSHVDLDVVSSRLMRINREKWWTAAADMTKLRTFREVYDEQDHMGVVYTNLTQRQKSLIVRLKIGILPLGLEVGHFTDKPIEYRTCCICQDNLLEDEYHFLLYCDALTDIRSSFFEEYNYLEDLDDPTDKVALCKLMLNSHNLKHTGRFLENMFERRMTLLYEVKKKEEEEK